MTNGIRQPQESNCASVVTASNRATSPDDNRKPTDAQALRMLPNRPRRRDECACSATMIAAPPYSPPRAIPWAMRSNTSSTVEMTPAIAYVGRNAISNVATPMIERVHTRVFLRPSRSPRCPNMMPPRGRATYPTVNVDKPRRVAATGSVSGKKSLPSTSVDRDANTKKSNHSMTVPTPLATRVRRIPLLAPAVRSNMLSSGLDMLTP